ncbi:MAG TPA: DUF5808 domain-containing protein [Candidatus Dormibacteraeota bacterium]
MRLVRRLRRVVKLAGFGLMVAAISQEMSKPEAEREWHGKVAGLVPYDFRPPTWERIRAAYWNPDEPRLFTDRAFGVGWAINLYRAKEYLEEGFGALMGDSKPARTPARKRAAR